MKKIKLTQGKFALVDDEDYEWLSNYKWHYNNGYASRRLLVKENRGFGSVFMHQEILETKGNEKRADHINRNGLDNRRSNLRLATASQNAMNKVMSNGSSKYKGVRKRTSGKRRKIWRATVWKDNQPINLGTYLTEEEAARAYNKKALEIHGQFAIMNDV